MSLFSTNCAPKGRKITAGVAQLVEHFLAKEDVASSSLVTRSNYLKSKSLNYVCFGQTEALLLRSVDLATVFATPPFLCIRA